MKIKKSEWTDFSCRVLEHIQNYCIPQYGDYPDEMIEEFSISDIRKQLERYVKRIGVDIRGIEESKRDALKIAHYACLLLAKIEGEKNA